MGTYGPGEIADLCRWCPPEIAVITAIGPVHLERFGSEDRIVEAKAEITVEASTVVLNVDDPRLGALADRLVAQGKRVVRCSASDIESEISVVRHAGGMTVRIAPGGAPVPAPAIVPVNAPTGVARRSPGRRRRRSSRRRQRTHGRRRGSRRARRRPARQPGAVPSVRPAPSAWGSTPSPPGCPISPP